MQFQYNSDYPGLVGGQPAVPVEAISRDPLPCPPAQPISCARITTRVFHPNRNQVATVQNVLVRTGVPPGGGGGGNVDDDFSDMSSTSSDSSDDSMKLATEEPSNNRGGGGGGGGDDDGSIQNAYWIQRTIREAIYGRVLFAVVLQRRPRALAAADGAEWEVTSEHCAVKEMSWQHIRKERDRLAEDPIKEVSCMQHIKKFYEETKRQKMMMNPTMMNPTHTTNVTESFTAMRDLNIMMPLDLLTDERNLYSVMPYCDGGELFERLDLNERFSEEEARYWMDQVLNVRVMISIDGLNRLSLILMASHLTFSVPCLTFFFVP